MFRLTFSQKRACPINEVLSARVRMNKRLVLATGECTHTWTRLEADTVTIVHHIIPEHGTTPWGWQENLCLEVTCSPLSNDIIEAVKTTLHNINPGKFWDGRELYTFLEENGVSNGFFLL